VVVFAQHEYTGDHQMEELQQLNAKVQVDGEKPEDNMLEEKTVA